MIARPGGRDPVHTIDAWPAYGRRASVAISVHRMSRAQRLVRILGRPDKNHHARHKSQGSAIPANLAGVRTVRSLKLRVRDTPFRTITARPPERIRRRFP
ncbi:hypothetical protein GCM10023107_33160 [Actinoplanes octamycinicus]|nr:hypothetical protein Aoc01nite_47220 [Actinoplanes octamycinicus]